LGKELETVTDTFLKQLSYESLDIVKEDCMKNMIKFFGITALVAVIGFSMVSCATTGGPRVRSPISGIVSVIPGGTLNLRISGKEVTVKVSSTEDGTGAVASGTTVSDSGVLTVDASETAQNLYVIATSAEDGANNTLQIRVVTVTEVVITPATATVEAGQYGSFSAQVNGTNNPNQNVSWTVGSSADATGTVRPLTLIVGGALTVNAEERGYLYVKATSVVDPTKSAIVRVNITPPPPKAAAAPAASQPAASAAAASQPAASAAAAPAASQPAASAAAAPAASQPAASAPAASQPAAQQQPAQQQPAQNPQPLVGTWRSAGFNVTAYTLNADGTGTYSLGSSTMNLTWTVSGNRLTVNTNMGNAGIVTSNFTYNIIGNVLTLQSTAGGIPIPMTRQ
jgi:hypothetical protein